MAVRHKDYRISDPSSPRARGGRWTRGDSIPGWNRSRYRPWRRICGSRRHLERGTATRSAGAEGNRALICVLPPGHYERPMVRLPPIREPLEYANGMRIARVDCMAANPPDVHDELLPRGPPRLHAEGPRLHANNSLLDGLGALREAVRRHRKRGLQVLVGEARRSDRAGVPAGPSVRSQAGRVRERGPGPRLPAITPDPQSLCVRREQSPQVHGPDGVLVIAIGFFTAGRVGDCEPTLEQRKG